MKTLKKHIRCSGVFIVNFEQIPHLMGIWKSVAGWVYQQRSKGREVKIIKHAKTCTNYAILTIWDKYNMKKKPVSNLKSMFIKYLRNV